MEVHVKLILHINLTAAVQTGNDVGTIIYVFILTIYLCKSHQSAQQSAELAEFRRIREEQDREFQQSLQADREKVLISIRQIGCPTLPLACE